MAVLSSQIYARGERRMETPQAHPRVSQAVRRRDLLKAGLAAGVTWSTWPLHQPQGLWAAEAGPPKRGGILRVRGYDPVGRIRARYLTARLPNPPVRPVRETFASYGSRERDIMGKVHFASSTVHSPWTALRVRWVPVYCFPTLSLRAFAMCAVFPHSDYYALFDCL